MPSFEPVQQFLLDIGIDHRPESILCYPSLKPLDMAVNDPHAKAALLNDKRPPKPLSTDAIVPSASGPKVLCLLAYENLISGIRGDPILLLSRSKDNS